MTMCIKQTPKSILNKYCIVGCHYNGTTSLYQYMKDKKLDVKRDEGLFTLPNGYRKYPTYYPERIPVIIVSDRKKELWEFMLKKWLYLNPLLVSLEDMSLNPEFPKRPGARHGDEEL